MTPFKTIWPNFITVYLIHSFQDHLIWFSHCVPNWLLSRPYHLILLLCTLFTPFEAIWPNFIIVYSIDSFQDLLPDFCIVYPIDSFQDDLTQFHHWVPNWLLSRPYDLIFALCTQLTPFKTIWPIFIIAVPYWLLSRPFNLILSLCTQLTPFNTIWPDFGIVYTIDCFQDHLIWIDHCVPNWLLSKPFDPVLSLGT